MTAAAGLVGISQATIQRDGAEYNLAPAMVGDQSLPDLALRATGGYVVWQDNVGDGDGLSVNARKVNSTLSGDLNVISLATKTAGNQENPRVALLSGGGTAFTWQGGPSGGQQIWVRVMNSAGVFVGEEVAASSHSEANQIQPAIAGLANGNFVVVWSADGPDGSMQGVYGMLFSANGAKIGNEFQINQFTLNNQRTPAVTALLNGGFAVTWVSEGERNGSSVDVYARLYNANGVGQGAEFRVNSSERVTSSPSIATTSAGNFTVVWCEISQDPNILANAADGAWISPGNSDNGWDVYACGFSQDGSRLTAPTRINQYLTGTQKNPSIATVGRAQMVVWTSFGQDGDREGIVGRALSGIGAPQGNEAVVNTVTAGQQFYPVVKGDGDSRFVVCWANFASVASGMELRAQRYLGVEDAVSLPQPPAPYVIALSQTRLSVTWPSVDGYDVGSYELYINGSSTPTVLTGQMTTITGLAPGASVRFEIAYRLRDGQLSPRSPEVIGQTWGEDGNDDTLPDDWQTKYWGSNWAAWPSASADSDHDGVSNYNEYLAGTDPTDANSVLRTQFVVTAQGLRLSWNTVPGQMYQVKATTDFATWQDFGGQRFAPGTSDSVSVPVGNSLGYYRVTRIR